MHHWTEKDRQILDEVRDFQAMLEFALPMLAGLPKPTVQICGPISTGGVGNSEGNVRILEETMRRVHARGYSIFNQLPFERSMKRLAEPWARRGEYCEPILEVFYHGVFRSGHLSGTMFLPNWKTSYGTRWERKFVEERGAKHGIEIIDLPIEWVADLLPPSSQAG